MTPRDVRISKLLSLVLRHDPGRLQLDLDSAGWVDVDRLLRACADHGQPLDRADLERVVVTNSKQRFSFSACGQRIRANQGHSVEVDLGLAAIEPPRELFHGTASRFLDSIREQGLLKRARQHVHLSADAETAAQVGGRHGKPVVLVVAAGSMHGAGHGFWLSANGVWLADHVPVGFISFP
jgi:putative RNA 2'-phosphotransferase